MEKDLKIGMSFSGGGYRAATFSLGTLSFLNSVRLQDGRSLLDCVTALSSVSGGTIPAMKYMLACARGQRADEMVNELFSFLCNEDLMTHALQELSDQRANRDASSIRIMAGVYDRLLFGNADMGYIIDNFDHIPVKDYTALAADFDNSLPFRFRLTEGRMTDGSRMTYGVFGNQKHSIGRSVVRHITAGEAMACSSCFPSGFEPMMYPRDFRVSQLPDLADGIKTEFGIMDGGVVDNQGIDPIVLAEQRLSKYREDDSRTDKALDLVIVSDVASPYMEGYAPCDQMISRGLGKLTLGRLRNYGLIAEALMMVLFILALVLGSNFWLGVMSVLLVIVTVANIVGAMVKNKLFTAISKTFVGNRAGFLNHLKFASIEAMIMNRAKSLVMLTSEVFLKRQRQMNYGTIYDDPQWRNRVVTSTVYELRPGERWQSMCGSGALPGHLAPSESVQQNSALAAGMGTTLWFTAQDKAAGMPQALLAAGQYTACYNLLVYIDQIEKDPTNLTDAHELIVDCKPQLLDAWTKFQRDPHWMVPKLV